MPELHHFPRDRVIRAPLTGGRTDAVAVTHLGMTKVYDCPGDMHAAVLTACAPELERAERACARRGLASFKARLRRRRAFARRMLRNDAVAGGAIALLCGAAAGLFGAGLGL